MGKGNMPTDVEVTLIAQAASMAAIDKTRELGYEDIMSALGIERAHEVNVTAFKVMEMLGPEGTDALVKLIIQAETEEMMEQADEALREGE